MLVVSRARASFLTGRSCFESGPVNEDDNAKKTPLIDPVSPSPFIPGPRRRVNPGGRVFAGTLGETFAPGGDIQRHPRGP